MKVLNQKQEDTLRTYYQQEFGTPTSSAELWSKLAVRLPAREHQANWWQRLRFFQPAVYRRPAIRPAYRLGLACSLLCAIILISSTIYATGGTSLLQRMLTNLTGMSQEEFTNSALSQTAGGFTVQVPYVEADANNVIIGYTSEKLSDGKFSQAENVKLATANGKQLPTDEDMYDTVDGVKPGDGAEIISFDAAGIQGQPQNLHLHLTMDMVPVERTSEPSSHTIGQPSCTRIPPDPLKSGVRITVCEEGRDKITIREGPPVTFTFDFSVPFHAGKTIQAQQSVTASGLTLTLERVVITPSEARAYIQGAPAGFLGGNMQVNRKENIAATSRPAGNAVLLGFDTLARGASGPAILKVFYSPNNMPSSPVQGPWTFTFQIP